MKTFGIEDELVLLDGMSMIFDDRWFVARKWVRVLVKRDTVEVSIHPPAVRPKQLFRMREIVLSELPEEKLHWLGRIIGFEMIAYLNRHRAIIEPSALGD